MYSQKTKSWIKHLDFILLDTLCLHGAFVLAYMTRHGLTIPYGELLYRNMAIVYTLVDIAVLIMNNTMKGVLKRGFYKEAVQTLRHVFMVTAILLVYLFSAQYGEAYSRVTFYLTSLYYLALSYNVRVAWKVILRHRKRDALIAAVYFISTSDCAEQVLAAFQKNSMGSYKIQGMCLLDRDIVGQSILGVPVTATKNNLLEYLCGRWVDEVFVSIPLSGEYPEEPLRVQQIAASVPDYLSIRTADICTVL